MFNTRKVKLRCQKALFILLLRVIVMSMLFDGIRAQM
jgi:hypothetical protein